MTVRIGLIVAAALLLPAAAQAQAIVGDRVRVTAPAAVSEPVTGEIVAQDSLALRIEVEQGVLLTLPRGALTGLELSEGRHLGRNILVGAASGLVVGAVLGAVVLVREAEGADPLGQAVGAMAGGVAGGLLGIPVGGFTGAVIAHESWRRASTGVASAAIAGGSATPASIEVLHGTRIRVTTAERRMKGAAVRSTSGLRLETGDSIASLPWSDVLRLEARARNREFGALVGGGLLGGVTFVAAAVDFAEDEVGADDVVLATALNFVIGAGIGALIAPRTWRDVPLPLGR